MERKCVTCEFFVVDADKQEGDTHDGHCHRYPPVHSGDVKEKRILFQNFWFPIVEFNEWCGEWVDINNDPKKEG